MTFSHLEVRKMYRKNFHWFLWERKLYLLKLLDAKNNGENISPATIKVYTDMDLSQSLVTFDEFPGATNLEEVTEYQLN